MKTKMSTIALASLLISSSVMADNMMVRTRAISIMPNETGTVAGGDVTIGNASVPELDFSYFFSDSFALELILATATHSVGVYNSSLGNVNLGNVSLLPPTLLAQYHKQFGKFKPYVGAGLNYTIFYGADSGSDEINSLKYKDTLGYAFQVGADYQIGDNLYLNLDIKKLYVSTEVEANNNIKANVNINPLVVGAGIGFKF